MSYEVKWRTEDSIILVRLWGDLSIDEFPEFDRLILQHIDQSQRSLVHVWVNLKEVTKFPANVRQVHKALTHLNHERVGWSVIITDNRLIKFVGHMITQLTKNRFRAFTTEAEATEFLKTMDTELALT
jgi:hypothetical protein